ncbi:MAG: M20/M25/M40 family metallo-hydrolase [Vicinamibacteria bacterium]
MILRALFLTVLLALSPVSLHAQDASERLLQLTRVPGVSGHESDVRKLVSSMLPATARAETDTLGNLIVRMGSGSPRTLVVAPLDEPGYVVSGVTDDGYLRLHKPTTGLTQALAHEYHVGQPVLIQTAKHVYANGVTATPSTHLRGAVTTGDAPRSIDDLFVDVGASSQAEVAALGIRVLDAVTLRERATRLSGSEVAGSAVSARAGAASLLEVVNRLSVAPKIQGSVVIAWTAQSFFGQRGLLRLVESEKPDRLIAFTGALAPGKNANGSTGDVGGGPMVRDDDAMFATSSAPVQKRSSADLPFNGPKGLETHVVAIPSRYAQTPVETVDARDVEAAAQMIASGLGISTLFPPVTIAPAIAPPATIYAEDDLRLLARLVRAYGVSTHEEAVRAEVLRQVPTWAKPEVDQKGNVIVRFGSGGKPLMFVAHTDEVGFEITAINEDGTASVRPVGGMYFSIYEAHPVVVHTAAGRKAAILAPRKNYAASTTLEPDLKTVVLDIGAKNRAEAEAAGLAVGQAITPIKDLVKLGEHRATARSLDDRNGSTALLRALQRIDPALVKNRITFVWSVEEETGLSGAAFVAASETFHTVFAVDTFVSSDTPVDPRRIAYAPLGKGAVLRGLDNRSLVPSEVMDRITTLARDNTIPLQIGVTGGGTDAAPFSAKGAFDVGLSWPGRYSHSPVEVMDRRDLESLTRLLVVLAQKY